MDLEEEFKKIVDYELFFLENNVITPYIINCFQSLCNFIKEKLHISVRFTYHNTDRIVKEFYKIGIENCQKEYDYYNSILKFKDQFSIDFQLMTQIRQKYYTLYYFSDHPIFKTNNDDIKKNLKKDMEFYINKYKFYNSFRITLS
jgi:hypothetical protein